MSKNKENRKTAWVLKEQEKNNKRIGKNKLEKEREEKRKPFKPFLKYDKEVLIETIKTEKGLNIEKLLVIGLVRISHETTGRKSYQISERKFEKYLSRKPYPNLPHGIPQKGEGFTVPIECFMDKLKAEFLFALELALKSKKHRISLDDINAYVAWLGDLLNSINLTIQESKPSPVIKPESEPITDERGNYYPNYTIRQIEESRKEKGHVQCTEEEIKQAIGNDKPKPKLKRKISEEELEEYLFGKPEQEKPKERKFTPEEKIIVNLPDGNK